LIPIDKDNLSASTTRCVGIKYDNEGLFSKIKKIRETVVVFDVHAALDVRPVRQAHIYFCDSHWFGHFASSMIDIAEPNDGQA
jgi:hypothetical protein